jgi:hypothetical protein
MPFALLTLLKILILHVLDDQYTTKKPTITVENDIYAGLHDVIGRRRIGRFLNDLARPHVTGRDLAEGYRAMAADAEREAAEWVENSRQQYSK